MARGFYPMGYHPAHESPDHSRHAVSAELLGHLGRAQQARGRGRSGWGSGSSAGGSGSRRPAAREDSADAWASGSCGGDGGVGEAARPADRGDRIGTINSGSISCPRRRSVSAFRRRRRSRRIVGWNRAIEVTVGDETLEVLHCPGHTPGHVVFFHPRQKFAWVGDVIFAGSIGRSIFRAATTTL